MILKARSTVKVGRIIISSYDINLTKRSLELEGGLGSVNDYYIDPYGNVARKRSPPSMQKFKEEPLVPLGRCSRRSLLIAEFNRSLWYRSLSHRRRPYPGLTRVSER